MYKETWELEDGQMINIVICEGHLNEEITRNIKPYYSDVSEGWIFNLPCTNGFTIAAEGPEDVVIYKAFPIK
jgi:hypothetical protein